MNEARHPVFDAVALVDDLSHFTALSSGLVKSIDIRRDGKWGQRLLKDRAQLAEVMDGFMERAPKEMALALPMVRGGTFSGGPKAADFAHKIDDERLGRAERYVRLVAGCRPVAVAASFGASQKKAEDEMLQLLQGYSEDMVKELRGPESPRRANAESQLEFVAGLTAMLYGEEEADLLRRRARAALASQAAA